MISKSQIRFVKQLEQKKYRLRENAFVAEGPKVVGDLLEAGYQPMQIFATETWAGSHHETCTTVTADELRKISFLQHPQHVLAVFHIPQQETNVQKQNLILALDNVQDPGNLGTIIRIADWFGIDNMVCSHDTADAWSPKVVQATMGSIARVHIYYRSLTEFLSTTTLPVYGTFLDGSDIYRQQLPQQAVIVMGNEGNGISQEVRQLCTNRLLIPSFRPGAESLNVAIATAITCSEFRRQGR
ncbi:MAG: RNA methyltransferase [Prevotella sp.]|nr:RNA methyltransferase [Prevotella sp.]